MEQGRLIQDRYELTSEIGTGGMARVWKARDTRLNRDVAVKFLDPNLCEDPEFLVRFFSEAQSVARISHPAVVSVLDFGQDEDRPYLVMEFVEGGSVAELAGQPLSVERSLEIVAQAAAGVGAAHAEGLVHRDIKPANLLLDGSGNIKVADFSIPSSRTGEKLTATGTAIGSPHYISPEQVTGDMATPASDVYSLGVVLYELLTGRRPFDGDNITAIAIAHVDKQPQPPSAHDPEIDPVLDGLVMRCLAKDPEERFPDGEVLSKAVEGTLAGILDDGTGAIPLPEDIAPSEGATGKPRALATILVVILLLLAASAVVFASSRSDDRAAATTTSEPGERSPKQKRKKPSASPSATSIPATIPSPSPSSEPKKEKNEVEKVQEAEEVSEAENSEEVSEPTEPSPTPQPETSPEASPATEEGTQQVDQSATGSS
ncbi:MAG: protein kinase domain-containing protein [Actinomycetota bacterium]